MKIISGQAVAASIGSALLLVLGIVFGLQWADGPDGRSADPIETRNMLRADPFQVQVVASPEAPRIDANKVLVLVTDLVGAPVYGARVTITAILRAMGTMPEMRMPADVTQTGPGQYEGTFSLPMDDSWPLIVRIDKPGVGSATLVFDIATRRRGLELVSGPQDPTGQAAQQ